MADEGNITTSPTDAPHMEPSDETNNEGNWSTSGRVISIFFLLGFISIVLYWCYQKWNHRARDALRRHSQRIRMQALDDELFIDDEVDSNDDDIEATQEMQTSTSKLSRVISKTKTKLSETKQKISKRKKNAVTVKPFVPQISVFGPTGDPVYDGKLENPSRERSRADQRAVLMKEMDFDEPEIISSDFGGEIIEESKHGLMEEQQMNAMDQISISDGDDEHELDRIQVDEDENDLDGGKFSKLDLMTDE